MSAANGKGKGGRPSKYTEELTTVLCERLASGQSLREICRDPAMPCDLTVRRWLLDGKHPAFCAHYAQARELQADQIFEELCEIADDGRNDWMERNVRGKVELVCDHENVNRSRLRVDARKWILARMSPKRYGELL